MSADIADPLADIPERENESPRGDAEAALFHMLAAITPHECDALLDVYRLYDESGRTRKLTRLNSVYLGGYPGWETRHEGVKSRRIVTP